MDDNKFPAIMEGKIGASTVKTVSARSLHSFLNVGKDFSNWIKDRIEQYGFTENVDFVVFAENGVNLKGGRPSKEYALTLDMGKELGMVERSEKGKQVRQYFIQCEKKALAGPDMDDPALLRSLLLDNVEKVIALEAKVEADAPKTKFFDSYLNADGLYGIQNAARALGCRPNKFSEWLRSKFVFYQGGNLTARAAYIGMGIFTTKTTIVDDKVRTQAFITPKGLKYLEELVPAEIRLSSANLEGI